MFKHSLLLTYRHFIRFKSSFFINLIGLSTGLACVLMIYLWVSDELRVDKFHEHDKRLFQAMLNLDNTDGINTAPATPALLAGALKKEMPEVEYAVATTSGIEMSPFLLSVEGKNSKAIGQYAGPDFFKMFSYKLMQGGADKVLSDKRGIVISEELALKLFNTTENVIGKSVLVQDGEQYLVSGVFKGVPSSSSEQFDFLLPFEVFRERMGQGGEDWGSTGPRTFVLLREGANLQEFNSKVADFIQSKNEKVHAALFFRPFSDRYLYNEYENGVQEGGRIAYVRLFSIIAVFILLIACINFMNLSTAKASRRLKEVGVKKTLGARRSTLIFQYLGESIFIASLALLLALLFVQAFLPEFNDITGKQLRLSFDFSLILSFLTITFITGLIAGSYPALYLSGFKPASILKGGGSMSRLSDAAGEGWARKGLVVFQFTLSVLFIVSVLVVYRQIAYVQSKNLGYDRDNILYFEKEGQVEENAAVFLSEVKRIPGIINASATSHNLLGNKVSTTGIHWEGKNPEEQIPFEIAWVDYGLLETLDIEMATGRTFSRDFGTDSTKIILNQAAIETMGLRDPIGKTINLWGDGRQIVGVTKNLHFESLHEEVKPMFFIIEPARSWWVMVKIEAGKEAVVLPKLQELYATFNPAFPFEFKFLDASYQAQYVAEQRVSVLSRYFAGIAILISCLGLYGLAAFAAEQRRKEIGIRKVLGASVTNIMALLSKDFLKLVFLAIVMGSLLSWLAMSSWLEGFAYRIELGWWVFGIAGAAALLIALFTVSFQAIKAANTNPVTNLRSE